MTTIAHHLGADHRRCDEQIAAAETWAARHNWRAAITAFLEFDSALRCHLDIEESILFPAFEQAPGAPPGPTGMMRAEHQQIRDLTDSMKAALLANDADAFSAGADVLHILMGQHNMKEESVLYPMADRFLAGRAGDVIAEMQRKHNRSGDE